MAGKHSKDNEERTKNIYYEEDEMPKEFRNILPLFFCTLKLDILKTLAAFESKVFNACHTIWDSNRF